MIIKAEENGFYNNVICLSYTPLDLCNTQNRKRKHTNKQKNSGVDISDVIDVPCGTPVTRQDLHCRKRETSSSCGMLSCL